MECRDARPLIARLPALADPDRRRLDLHLRACPACRDEVSDPIGVFAPPSLPMATPPPGLTAAIMARLPAAAPLALAERGQRERRLYRRVAVGVAVALVSGALAGIVGLQIGT